MVGLVSVGTGGRVSCQSQVAQFRAGTELTRLELTVLDRRTRQPIKGLTADDFLIEVDGDSQPVQTLAEVTSPGVHTAQPTASSIAIQRDVVTNTGRRQRLFVIIMNDASGLNDPFDRTTAKAIARRIVSSLEAGDMASVIFTRDNRQPQDFTDDHALLFQAIERFNPMFTVGVRPMSVVRRAQDFLAGTPGFRRAIVFITPSMQTNLSNLDLDSASAFGLEEDRSVADREMRAIRTGGQIGHVPIYSFSTHGLHAPTTADLKKGNLGRDSDQADATLRTIASLTGGRAIVGTNAPEQLVPAMFEELSIYYALGFRPTYPLDGKVRWLKVSVKRPEAIVMPSGVPIATTQALASAGSVAATRPGDSGLAEALTAPISFGAVPLSLAMIPIAVAGSREQALALALTLPPVPAAQKEQFRVRLMMFDGEGRRELLGQALDVTVAGGERDSLQGQEIVLRIAQRPGRYNLRVVVEQLSNKLAGSIHATVTIPDFSTDSLSVSGVAIGRAEGAAVGGGEAVRDILPFVPTAVRRFGSTDHVGALFRVHQGAKHLAQAVTVESEILDAGGRSVARSLRTIPASDFRNGVGVEHRFDVPLSSLDVGGYLLRFEVRAGGSPVQREVRFSVSR